jgi:hypothetical protein
VNGVWLLRSDIGTWVFTDEMDAIVKEAQIRQVATFHDLSFTEFATKVEPVFVQRDREAFVNAMNDAIYEAERAQSRLEEAIEMLREIRDEDA